MRKLALVLLTVVAASCASSTPPSLLEARKIVGTENDVRVDAEIFGEFLSSSVSIPVKYAVTNNRQAAIAIADLVPETSWDSDTRTVTMTIGSEVPGAAMLPRLIAIAPGEKKTFSATARVNVLIAEGSLTKQPPNAIRLKVNFLGDTAPFAELVNMSEKGLYDPKLADELFPKWLERNESVYTNTLPMHWTVQPPVAPAASRGRG